MMLFVVEKTALPVTASIILLYCALGSIVGIFAGLLGIGGGALVVPMLIYAFGWQHFPPEILVHMALGTSLASIMFTALSSSWAHHRLGTVDWKIFASVTPGVMIGTYSGSFLAARLRGDYLQVAFACFLLYLVVNIFMNRLPRSDRVLPGFAGMSAAGLVVGVMSSLVGIGGGSLIMAFLAWHNVDMRKTISTSAAIGFPLALSGCLGYIVSGWGIPGLPAWSLGFVYLPAMLGIVAISMLTAPVGAWLSHKMPVLVLRKIFAVFLLAIAVKILTGLL